jgi:hypothetical protein
MTRVMFDAMIGEMSGALSARGEIKDVFFPLEVAFEVACSLAEKRKVSLRACVPEGRLNEKAMDALVVIDSVASAAAFDLGRTRPLRPEENPSQVVDLWTRATAARSLWYDLFVQWPGDNSTKKLKALMESAIVLGTEAVAQGLHSGVQPAKFTGFVASLARGEVKMP